MSGRPIVFARLPASDGTEDELAHRRRGDARADEVGGATDHDLDVAARVRVEQLLRHRRARRALLVLGARRRGLGHRRSARGAVRVEVLERDEARHRLRSAAPTTASCSGGNSCGHRW